MFDCTGEGLVWRRSALNGRWEPFGGLLGSDGEDRRDHVVLTSRCPSLWRETLYVEVACTNMFGVGEGSQWGGLGPTPPDLARRFPLKACHVAQFDREAWQLLMDLKVISGAAASLPEDSVRARQALVAAERAMEAVNLKDRATWARARELTTAFLTAKNGDGQHTLFAVGNCHIDSAWLWATGETVRKCARSFASQLRLLERYPHYIFCASQAQQFEWTKSFYPGLWEEVLAKVREGRFVPVGGTWVEPDCNLPSGESLVRQFLYGQRFFEREFGARASIFWLPDTFGYSAQLPQICRGAGVSRFLTQKLSWNQYNKMPHHTFMWAGIDGSEVLAHFPPCDTYNAHMEPKELVHAVKNFRDKEIASESLFLFGHGDGGGGPNDEMLTKMGRLADCDGLPRVAPSTPEDFFRRAEGSRREHGLPTFAGELYFEKHRGTYTTAAANKRDNRLCEDALRKAELVWAAREVEAAAGAAGAGPYPHLRLRELWQDTLLNQFHDIIPGSSIHKVYEDSDRLYRATLADAAELTTRALQQQQQPAASAAAPARVVVNPLEWDRAAVVEGAVVLVPALSALGLEDARSRGALVKAAAPASARVLQDGSVELSNFYLRARIGRCGRVTSLVHLDSGRESLRAGAKANVFALYDDVPLFWDAWDVDSFHLHTRREVGPATEVRVLRRGDDTGGLRASVRVEWAAIGEAGSTLAQTITLDATSRVLEFACEVDWRETHKLLKVEATVDVLCDSATYGIQYGHLRRPTHFNTSWDEARFEVCAQRWADLSEHGFGVALMSDSKYGFSVHGCTMAMSLLRSPKHPDPEMDMGAHRFLVGLMPHAGSHQDARVEREARAFGWPLHAEPGRPLPQLLAVDNPAVAVGAVKLAEAEGGGGPARLIVRLNESFGGRASARITPGHALAKRARRCQRVNLLEDKEGLQEVPRGEDGSWAVVLKPFEIATLAFELEQ